MSGPVTNLLTGLAVDLDTGGIGEYKTSGAYSATDTAIVLDALPTDPPIAIALMAYPVRDDPTQAESVIGVQVTVRTGPDKRDNDDLQDDIFDRWQNHAWTLSTGVHIAGMHRNSGPASLGNDEHGRWKTVSNYYVRIHRASTYRT